MDIPESLRAALDQVAKPFGRRVCYASDTRRALSVVPAGDIVKCDGCGREYHVDWGEFCPDCTGAD